MIFDVLHPKSQLDIKHKFHLGSGNDDSILQKCITMLNT
jgi:hypothetical protein